MKCIAKLHKHCISKLILSYLWGFFLKLYIASFCVIIVKLSVESVLQRAYAKITTSRINSLPLRFIRGGAFFLGAFPATVSLKALEKGYDHSLKSCRGHKEKTASALSCKARLHFSCGATTTGGPPCCHRRTFSNFLAHARLRTHSCVCERSLARRYSTCI